MSRYGAPRRSAIGRDEGQALVEFALVLPILLLLIFGMIQIGLVLHARQTVAYAAQVAAATYAQTLALGRAGAEAVFITAPLRPRLAPGDVSYRLHPASGSESAITSDGIGQVGDFVIARVAYSFPSPVRASFGGFRFPDAITITMDGVARIEKQGKAATGAGTTATQAAQRRGCYIAHFELTSADGSLKPLTSEILSGYAIAGSDWTAQAANAPRAPTAWLETRAVLFPLGSSATYTTPFGGATITPDQFERGSQRTRVATGMGAGRGPGPWNVDLLPMTEQPTSCDAGRS